MPVEEVEPGDVILVPAGSVPLVGFVVRLFFGRYRADALAATLIIKAHRARRALGSAAHFV